MYPSFRRTPQFGQRQGGKPNYQQGSGPQDAYPPHAENIGPHLRRAQNLQNYMDFHQLTPLKLAASLETSLDRIEGILSGRAPMSDGMAMHYEEMLGLKAGWLDSGEDVANAKAPLASQETHRDSLDALAVEPGRMPLVSAPEHRPAIESENNRPQIKNKNYGRHLGPTAMGEAFSKALEKFAPAHAGQSGESSLGDQPAKEGQTASSPIAHAKQATLAPSRQTALQLEQHIGLLVQPSESTAEQGLGIIETSGITKEEAFAAFNSFASNLPAQPAEPVFSNTSEDFSSALPAAESFAVVSSVANAPASIQDLSETDKDLSVKLGATKLMVRHSNLKALCQNSLVKDLLEKHCGRTPKFFDNYLACRSYLPDDVLDLFTKEVGVPRGWFDVPHSEYDAHSLISSILDARQFSNLTVRKRKSRQAGAFSTPDVIVPLPTLALPAIALISNHHREDKMQENQTAASAAQDSTSMISMMAGGMMLPELPMMAPGIEAASPSSMSTESTEAPAQSASLPPAKLAKKNSSAAEEKAASTDNAFKRGRGRPKGSKNKANTEESAVAVAVATAPQIAAPVEVPKPRRGRPLGSTKAKAAEKAAAAAPKKATKAPKVAAPQAANVKPAAPASAAPVASTQPAAPVAAPVMPPQVAAPSVAVKPAAAPMPPLTQAEVIVLTAPAIAERPLASVTCRLFAAKLETLSEQAASQILNILSGYNT